MNAPLAAAPPLFPPASAPPAHKRPIPSPGTGGPHFSTHTTYDSDTFVARYAAVWAYGIADPDRTSQPYYEHVLSVALPDGHPLPRTVLEVGCGPGRIIADLASRVPRAQCTAVDAAATMVALARAILHTARGTGVAVDAGDFGFAPAIIPTHGRPDITVLRRRLEDLDPSRQYDLVVASHLLDRVTSPKDSLRALAALTAPGGRLVVTCAFNYQQRHQWTMANGTDIATLLSQSGLRVEVLNEDVSYRERLDIRGTVTEHRVAVLRAHRPAQG